MNHQVNVNYQELTTIKRQKEVRTYVRIHIVTYIRMCIYGTAQL